MSCDTPGIRGMVLAMALGLCFGCFKQSAAEGQLPVVTSSPVVKPSTVVGGQQITVYGSLALFGADIQKPKVFVKAVVCKVGGYAVFTNRCSEVLDESCDSLVRIETSMLAGMSKQMDGSRALFRMLDKWELPRTDVITKQQLSIPHDAQSGAYDVWYTAGISESASCDGVRGWLMPRYKRIHIGRGD